MSASDERYRLVPSGSQGDALTDIPLMYGKAEFDRLRSENTALREVLDAALAFQKATNNAYLANVGWSSTSVGDLRPPFTGTQWDEYRAMERAIDRYDALRGEQK